MSHRRWDLNQLLSEVAGKASVQAGGALGREILAAAQAELDRSAAAGRAQSRGAGGSAGGSNSSGSGSSVEQQQAGVAGRGGEGMLRGEAAALHWLAQQGWRARLTAEVCAQLVEASRDVDFWVGSLREQKVRRRALLLRCLLCPPLGGFSHVAGLVVLPCAAGERMRWLWWGQHAMQLLVGLCHFAWPGVLADVDGGGRVGGSARPGQAQQSSRAGLQNPRSPHSPLALHPG